MRVTVICIMAGVAGMRRGREAGDREGAWVSHGAGLVATCAAAAGHSVDIVDIRHLDGWGDFRREIAARKSDIYGLSVGPVDYTNALCAVAEIRAVQRDCVIVTGGIHPTIFPEKYAYKEIDYVITGEGEISFVELLDSIHKGEQCQRVITGKKPDLSRLPHINRGLFQYWRELECVFAPDHRPPAVTMLAGRGCPYRCAYCQPAENKVFGHPYRMRPVDDVIDEMKELHKKYAYKSVTFWDDTFTFNENWVNEFSEKYHATGINAKIAVTSRADIICRRPDMVRRMAKAGVDWMVIGFESGSQRLLDLIQKGTTVEQNIEAAEICRSCGIKIFATYMYGLPTETPQETMLTARMIDEINPEHRSPFWYVPIPGTNLYNYCSEKGLLLDNEEYNNIARTGVYKPKLKGVDYNTIRVAMARG